MFPVAYNIEQFGFNSVEIEIEFLFFRSLEKIKFRVDQIFFARVYGILKLSKLVRTEGYDLRSGFKHGGKG